MSSSVESLRNIDSERNCNEFQPIFGKNTFRMCDVAGVVQPQDVQIVVLSGPSGSGKSTIVRELLAKSPVKLTLSVSATTRPPRQNEVDKRDYYFLSVEEFQKRLAADDFLEYAEVHSTGNWYGTLKSELDRARADGTWVLLEIDVQGARTILEQYPDAISIFLTTSDFEQRLRDRATETEEVIQKRLDTAKSELQHAKMYAHEVLNDKLPVAVDAIIKILVERQLAGEQNSTSDRVTDKK